MSRKRIMSPKLKKLWMKIIKPQCRNINIHSCLSEKICTTQEQMLCLPAHKRISVTISILAARSEILSRNHTDTASQCDSVFKASEKRRMLTEITKIRSLPTIMPNYSENLSLRLSLWSYTCKFRAWVGGNLASCNFGEYTKNPSVVNLNFCPAKHHIF